MSATAAAAHPKGRDAAKPTEIPTPGWKEIVLRVAKQFGKDRVMLVAAGTTFYLLLAMVPALTAFVSLYGLFADPGTVQQHISFIQDFMPSGGQEIIGEQLTRLSQQPNTGLGFALAISVGLALWSTNAGMKALFEAMNVAYDEEEKRGFVKLTLVSLAFTLGTIVLLLAVIGVVVVMPLVVEKLGLGSLTELLVKVGSGIVLLAAGLLGLSALYRWGPSRENAEWKWVTPGACVAIVIAMIGSLAFSWYVSNFGSYNETYGSLGAIIGFMTWLWIMAIFVVTGAELNAEMEHQTAKDTTTGPDRGMGQRGAQMADNVADGPDDTGKDLGGSTSGQSSDSGQSSNDRKRPERHGREATGSIRRYGREGAGTVSHVGTREPMGLTGGLMLLGALALAVAAGNAGRREGSRSSGPASGPASVGRNRT